MTKLSHIVKWSKQTITAYLNGVVQAFHQALPLGSLLGELAYVRLQFANFGIDFVLVQVRLGHAS